MKTTTIFEGLLFSCLCSFPSSPSWSPLLFPDALERICNFLLFCLKKLGHKLEPWAIPWDLWKERWWWSPLSAVWRSHKVTKECGVTCSWLLATGCVGHIEMLWLSSGSYWDFTQFVLLSAVSSPSLVIVGDVALVPRVPIIPCLCHYWKMWICEDQIKTPLNFLC